MKKIIILPSFERSVKRLSAHDKKRLAANLEQFNAFLISGKAPFGFRLKKINHDKYEFRVGIKQRVIIKMADEAIYLVLIGTHDEIKRHLRHFK